MGFEEHRVGLGGLLGWIYGFWGFSFVWGLILFLFGVFLTGFGVSIGFRWVLAWSSCWKSVNCGFWRTSRRLMGTLGVDSWYLGFSSVFCVVPVLLGALFDVFWGLRCVLVGFLLVTMVKKCKLWVLENIG